MLGKLQNDREFHLLPLKLKNDKVPLVKNKQTNKKKAKAISHSVKYGPS